MIEVFIPVFIAATTGFAVMINRIHNHINTLERRVDRVELRVATEYVPKADINYALDKIYNDILRIDEKTNKRC